MNIIDENIVDSQRRMLLDRRIRVRQIGHEIGRQGTRDEEIVPLLLRMRHPTLFSRDRDFFERALCHRAYCLVQLAVREDEVASFVRRTLRHPAFNTQDKRMGTVIRASETGLRVWRLHAEAEEHFPWPR